MQTIEDVRKAADAAEMRDTLLHLIDRAREERLTDQKAFGVPISSDLSDLLRALVVDDLLRRLSETEATLRELGIVFPGDPVPGLAPVVSMRGAPNPREVELGHPVIVPRSWDRKEGTFTVAVPCDPATSVRWLDGGLVQVDEALNPRGLSDGPVGTPVIDRTEGVEARVGTVTGWGFRHDGIELRVRLERPWDKVRAAIEARRLHLVGIGYEIRNEEIVSRPGQRPLADVLRWSLKEIRLHRTAAQAEAA